MLRTHRLTVWESGETARLQGGERSQPGEGPQGRLKAGAWRAQ